MGNHDADRHFQELLRSGLAKFAKGAPKPRLSRKTRRWTVQTGGRLWTVPEIAIGGALDHVARLAHLNPVLPRLFDQLLAVSLRSRPLRPRGSSARQGQAGFMAKARYAAAWAFLFAQAELRKPKAERNPVLEGLNEKLRKGDDGYSLSGRREQVRDLARRLVLRAFPPDEWRRVGLKPPGLETFVRRYIQSGRQLAQVREIVKRNPSLLSEKSAYLKLLLGTL